MELTVKMHSHHIRCCDESRRGCAAVGRPVVRQVAETLTQTVTTKTLSNSQQLQAPGKYLPLFRVAALPRQDSTKMEMEMLRFISGSDLV